jgi:protease-4
MEFAFPVIFSLFPTGFQVYLWEHYLIPEKPMKRRRREKSIFSSVLSFFNMTRILVLNLLFWGVLIALLVAFIPRPVDVPDNAILYVDPAGTLTERYPSEDNVSRLMGEVTEQAAETPVFKLSRTLRMAASDTRVNTVMLNLSALDYGSLAALQELEQDLLLLKEQGKTVFAWSEYYNTSSWYLAAAADQAFLDPMGMIHLPGFSLYRTYFGEALDNWNVDVNFIHAGEFKSYGEAYVSSSMSDDFKRENLRWLGSLWDQYCSSAASHRGIRARDIKDWIDAYPDLLSRKGMNDAQAALEGRLIDGIFTESEMDREISLHSEEGEYINWLDYAALLERERAPEGEKVVAVLNATGQIHGGSSMPWTIGSDTLVSDLDWVASLEDVRALVLRLDTGGGSAFASELIRRKLEELKREGIRVIVSMGGVTASGGYWIASAGDEIWADPGSITGSIGVFSLIPNVTDFASETLKLRSDGVGTTWMAGQERLDQPLKEKSRAVYQAGVDQTYEQFLSLVSAGRSMARETLRPYAEGRIWSGLEAVEIGLADKAGTLQQAIDSAAALAGLEEYHPLYIMDQPPTARDYLSRMTGGMVEWMGMSEPVRALRELGELKPGRVYALSGLCSPGQK